MLTKDANERLTRVGPGTPMGETMRRYWIPAVLSWELPQPDGPPVRVRLLGENLIAFRATDGRVGILDEHCPHRRASLFLGRNEHNGLRCVYHGWKFDVDGNCTEQMNEPKPFCNRVKIKAYPACEIGGVVWVYMGPSNKQPALPKFDWTQVPETHRSVSKVAQASNWLQALEGGIDTSHFTILHRAIKKNPSQPGIDVDDVSVQGGAPTLELDVTDYGYRYFGIRPLKDNKVYVRGYHFVMPFTQCRPPGPGKQEVHGHYWVPIDDYNCMVWNWYCSTGEDPISVESAHGNEYGDQVDIHNGFRSIYNRDNNWMIDRGIQKTDTYSGINGINQQDRAIQESMGPIVDRSFENLGPADRAIVMARRLLLEATEQVARDEDPKGVAPSYYELRASEGVLPTTVDWREELLPSMYPVSAGTSHK